MRKKILTIVSASMMIASSLLVAAADAQTTGSTSRRDESGASFRYMKRQSASRARAHNRDTFSDEEIIAKGHQVFGKASRGIAEMVAYVFRRQGEPVAYIVGEEGAGAFVGGLRYGEGTIYYKDGRKQRIFWQGPSLGFDFGGNGSRTMVLVYNSRSPQDLHQRFIGVEGSAYFVGGLGVNFQQNNHVVMAPIRTGLGWRLGANVGYLKYSARPTWNPF